jgi:hypothetical protein
MALLLPPLKALNTYSLITDLFYYFPLRIIKELAMEVKKDQPEQIDLADEPKTEKGTEQPSRQWGSQILGAAIGGFIFFILAGLALQFGWVTGNTDRWWLWGAVIGGILGATEKLNTAGARLTNGKNKLVNIVVALLGMAILIIIFYGLAHLISWILTRLNFS